LGQFDVTRKFELWIAQEPKHTRMNLAIVVVDELATYTIWLAMDVNIFSLSSAWIQWAFIFLINYSSKLITDL
jgi:hypothetical protein